jgi:very-short-patch-repair endonuclease
MLGRHDRTPHLQTFAKQLRKDSTDAERKLWSLVRDGQIAGYRFRRQHPIAGYILSISFVARLIWFSNWTVDSTPIRRKWPTTLDEQSV